MKHIRIGTVAGLPALTVTRRFLERFFRLYPALRMPGAVEIVEFIADGYGFIPPENTDFNPAGSLSRKMETALLSGDIDMAVCSLDNMPSSGGKKIKTACYMPREAPWDCIFSAGKYRKVNDIKNGAAIAAYDIRSAAFLSNLRNDLKITVSVRSDEFGPGLVKSGEYDGIIMPISLFHRSEFEKEPVIVLDNGETTPCVGSGAVCVEVIENNTWAEGILEKINDEYTERAVSAEREFLSALCLRKELPVAAHTFFQDKNTLCMQISIAKPDGSAVVRDTGTAVPEDYISLGKLFGEKAADIIYSGFCDG